jgi:proteic killer suppression protein
MIVSFRHKGLKQLFEVGKTAKIDRQMHRRITERLDALDAAKIPTNMNLPGYDFHVLRGFRPTRYSVHVNGPWCITFEFEGENAVRVDYEQYH